MTIVFIALTSVLRFEHVFAQEVSWCEPLELSQDGESAGPLLYPPLTVTTDGFGYAHFFWREQYEDGTYAVMYARAGEDGLEIVRDILPSTNEIPVGAFVDSEGYMHLTLTVANSYFILRSLHLADIDDARKWMSTAVLGVPGAVDVLPDGTWYSIRRELSAAYIAVSSDAGGSWSTERPLVAAKTPRKLLEMNLLFDSRNRLHMVYSSSINNYDQGGILFGDELAYVHSDDFGITWSNPLILDRTDERYDSGYGLIGLTLTVGSNGRIILVWNGAPMGQRNYRISEDGGMTWSSTEVLWRDYWRGVTGGHRLAEDSNGALHLVTGGFGNISGGGSGLLHASLRDNDWSMLERVGRYNADAEAHQVVATNGNRLHAVFVDVLDTQHAFYACGTVEDAPYVPGQPIPPPPGTEVTTQQVAAPVAVATPTPMPAEVALALAQPLASSQSIAEPLLIAALSAAGLLALALLYFIRFRGRHS